MLSAKLPDKLKRRRVAARLNLSWFGAIEKVYQCHWSKRSYQENPSRLEEMEEGNFQPLFDL